jgi:hypothetical protein
VATSTIPTTKANLVTQLQARAGLAGVQVSYGPPLPNPQREYIWVGDVTGVQEFAAMAAPNQRHEQYTVKTIIGVLKEGGDIQAADVRCFALMGEVEAQLRTDSTIGGAVAVCVITAIELAEFVAPDGMNRTAQLVLEIECQAWI